MDIEQEIIGILSSVLQLGERGSGISVEMRLLGSIPEFDSMSVVAVINALEEQFDLTVYDDELDASVFESVASLIEFVREKLSQ